LRAEKLERMKAMGIVSREQRLPRVQAYDYRDMGLVHPAAFSTEPLPEWSSVSAKDRQELDLRRAIYAAQIDRLDQNIGRIVDRLVKLGFFDNTLILFMSDNGCSGELGQFGMNWNEYRRDNYPQWRKKSGWSISQGQCWASYSNTPLRRYKFFAYEGGIASPFIAHWPARIKTPGRIYGDQMFHLLDIMPTLCEVAGAEYPATYQGREITPYMGVSMLPFLTGMKTEPLPRSLFWQHEASAAIREGNWKLVTEYDRSQDKWELYDLSSDRSETDDLSSEKPELVAEMQRKWHRWAQEVHALPYPEQRECRRIPLPTD
jgi:arylsulfatase A-like enzyme